MPKRRKAEGLPFAVIIAAIVMLVVLVVVIAIFTGNFGKFSKDIESCGIRGGECKLEKCTSNEKEIDASCPKDRPRCCVRIIG